MESLRLEKALRSWGHDICDIDTVVEAGLAFADASGKGVDFIRRDSVFLQRDEGVARWLAVFALEDPELLLGNEPIRRDGQPAARTTSGTFGHTLGVSEGMGHAPGPNALTPGRVRSGMYESEVAAERFPAKVRLAEPHVPRRVRL